MSEASRGSFARRLRHLAGALICLLVFLQVTPGLAGPQQTKTELDEAKRQANRLTEQLQGARHQAEVLQAEVELLIERIAVLTAQVETLKAAIREANRIRRKTNDEIEELQNQLDDRVREAYIEGPGTALELVLEADSLKDLSDRLGFLEVLQQDDSDLALGLQTERAQLAEYAANLREYEDEKRGLRADLLPQQRELQAKQAEQQALIAQIEEDRAEAEDLVDRLNKKYQAQLQAALASSSGVGYGGPPPHADGPFYDCPVDPPRSYVDTFGAPRPGGRTHEGNDIFAPTGTPIRAPFEGTAENGYDGLGGIVVHVYASANADYVYNAHLSQHAPVDGTHVQPGDLIGYVGNTGNAVGTSPHDHFEYHPGAGSAVSPYVYLNEVCGVNGAGF
jgi:murein DD-endopeptidase MepM/ murein hydrolase activator NlpD